MRPKPFGGRKLARGFTLVELIIAMVVLGTATVAIVSLHGGVLRGQSDNMDILVGAQLLQECTEKVLATRRRATNGYVSVVSSANCGGLAGLSGFDAPSVNVTDVDNSTNAACPIGAACKLVVISVTKGGDSLAPARLLLVNYIL